MFDLLTVLLYYLHMQLVTDTFPVVLADAVASADSEILLSFYTVTSPNKHHRNDFKALWDALFFKHNNRVKIKLLYNNNSHGSNFDAFVEKQALRLRNFPFPCRFLSQKQMLHTKFAIFDRGFIYIGSHNLTPYAAHRNIEAGVYFFDVAIAQKLRNYFFSFWIKAHAGL